jgi:hypothetical protein
MTGSKIAFIAFCAAIAAYCVFALYWNRKGRTLGEVLAEIIDAINLF